MPLCKSLPVIALLSVCFTIASSQKIYDEVFKNEYPYGQKVRIGNKYGFIDQNKRETIECKWDSISDFYQGYASVTLNRKFGVITSHGNIIVPVLYDMITRITNSFYSVKQNNKWGFLNTRTGQTIPCVYESMRFTDNIAIIKLEGKYGCFDTSGKAVVPVIYDSLSSMLYGFAFVMLNGKYGFINSNGKLVTPVKYEEVSFSYNGRQGMLNGKLYEIDDNGEEVGVADYDHPENRAKYDEFVWIGNYNIRIKKGTKYGLLDREHRLLSPCKWDSIADFYHLQAIIKLKGRYGAIDYNGKVIIPAIYDTIIPSGDFSDNYNVKLNDKWGYISGSYLSIPCQYDNQIFFYEKANYNKVPLAAASKAGRYGYVNTSGTLVVDHIYQKASAFNNGHSVVKSKNKYGIVNSTGKLVVPPVYDSVSIMSANGQAIVKVNGKYGIVTSMGKLIEPVKYDKIVFDVYGAQGIIKGTKVDLAGRLAKKAASETAFEERVSQYKRQDLERNFDTDDQITAGAKPVEVKRKTGWEPTQEIFTYKDLYGVRSTRYGKQIKIYPVMTSIKESYGSNALECVYNGTEYAVTVKDDNSLEYTTVCPTCYGTGYTSTYEKGGTLTREKEFSYKTKDYYNKTTGKVTVTSNEVTVVPSTTTKTTCSTCHGVKAKGKLIWKGGQYIPAK